MTFRTRTLAAAVAGVLVASGGLSTAQARQHDADKDKKHQVVHATKSERSPAAAHRGQAARSATGVHSRPSPAAHVQPVHAPRAAPSRDVAREQLRQRQHAGQLQQARTAQREQAVRLQHARVEQARVDRMHAAQERVRQDRVRQERARQEHARLVQARQEQARQEQARQQREQADYRQRATAEAARQARADQAERQRELARHRAEQQRDARQRMEAQRRAEAGRREDARRRAEAQRHRIDRAAQQRRIAEQHRRQDEYRRYADAMRHRERERARELERARRMAQYRYQQAYYQRMLAQQARLDALRYDYGSNPYFYSPANYLYSWGGNRYATNQYGADLLRQAVNYGYREGLRAGQADRYDGWRGGYANNFAYLDASYGYDNYYVDRSTYGYYFRQGFQRGYDDGYYSRSQYGMAYDGDYSILQAVLGMILNLQTYN